MSPKAPVGMVAATLPQITAEILESLYQHRVLSTAQLHELHCPQANRRWMQLTLAKLTHAQLVAWVRVGRGGTRLYHLTRAGTDAVELIPTRYERRRRLITQAMAAGPLHKHTWAVNQTGLAFVRAAREQSDECGALAWRHEIAHPTGPPAGRQHPLVIADAVLTYIQYDREDLILHTALIEVDRATQPVDALADKLARYADLRHYIPKAAAREGWREHYDTFPVILCLLTGATPTALARRARTVLAILAATPRLAAARGVRVRISTLAQLTEHGPFAQIFREPSQPDAQLDWLGGQR